MKRQLRLLMTTQIIDSDHPILGFAHTWVAKIAERIDELHVICRLVGRNSLPSNVRLYRLIQNTETSKLTKFIRFQKYAAPLLLMRQVDCVFVHQTEINALLAAPYAKPMGIPIVIFKAHGLSLRPSLRIATRLVDRVLTSEARAFPIETTKKLVIGQGIDIECFRKRKEAVLSQNIKKIISVGRYSPIKGYEVLIEACAILVSRGHLDFRFAIYGADHYQGCREYFDKLRYMIHRLRIEQFFELHGPIPYSAVAAIYESAYLVVHPSEAISLDKVVLEVMACERLVLTSTELFHSVLGENLSRDLMFEKNNAVELADKIEWAMSLSENTYLAITKELRQLVIESHSVDHLADRIVEVCNGLKVKLKD